MANFAQLNAGLRGAQGMAGNALNYLADQDRIRVAERQVSIEEDKWSEAKRIQYGQELGNVTLQAENRAMEAQQNMGDFLASNHDVAEQLFSTARQNNKRFAEMTQGKDVQLVRGEDGRFRLAERTKDGAMKFLQRQDGQGDVAFSPQQFAEYLDMENARFGRMSARRAYRIAEEKVQSGERTPEEFAVWVEQQFGPAYAQLVQETQKRGYDITDDALPEKVVGSFFGEITPEENEQINAQIEASGQDGTERTVDLRNPAAAAPTGEVDLSAPPADAFARRKELDAQANREMDKMTAERLREQIAGLSEKEKQTLRGGGPRMGSGGRSMQPPTKLSLRERTATETPEPTAVEPQQRGFVENMKGGLRVLGDDFERAGVPGVFNRLVGTEAAKIPGQARSLAANVASGVAGGAGLLAGGEETRAGWEKNVHDAIAGDSTETAPTDSKRETSKPALNVPDFTKTNVDPETLRPGQRRAIVTKLQTAFMADSKDQYKYTNSDRAAALTNLWAVNKLPHDNAIIANLMAGDDMRGSALAYAQASARHAASIAKQSSSDQKMRMEIWKHNEEYRTNLAKSFTEDQLQMMGFNSHEDASLNFDGAYAATKTVTSRLGYPSDWRDMSQSQRAHFGGALRRAMQVNNKVVGSFLGFGGTKIDGRDKVSQEIFPPLYAASMLAETQPQLFEAYYRDAQKQGFDQPDQIYEEIGKVVLQSKGVLTETGEE